MNIQSFSSSEREGGFSPAEEAWFKEGDEGLAKDMPRKVEKKSGPSENAGFSKDVSDWFKEGENQEFGKRIGKEIDTSDPDKETPMQKAA